MGVKRALNLESKGFHSGLSFSTSSGTVSQPHDHSEPCFFSSRKIGIVYMFLPERGF